MANWGKGRGGRPWARMREAVARRGQYRCQHCGRVTALEDGDCDHIKPESQGGITHPSNLQWLCRTPCHADKTAAEALQARGIQPKLSRAMRRKLDGDHWNR